MQYQLDLRSQGHEDISSRYKTSMNQYQRNRLPFTWELLDVKENDVCCGLPDICSSC